MPISHAHLRSFHAVATHGSFTRAAEMLNITQPTLSGQVKDLETRYGTKLFVRLGRRIELTDIGESAFKITRLLFRHEEEVEHLLQSARADLGRTARRRGFALHRNAVAGAVSTNLSRHPDFDPVWQFAAIDVMD